MIRKVKTVAQVMASFSAMKKKLKNIASKHEALNKCDMEWKDCMLLQYVRNGFIITIDEAF